MSKFKVIYRNMSYKVKAKDAAEAVRKVEKIHDNNFEDFLEHFDVFGVTYKEVPNDRSNGVAYQIKYKNHATGQEIREKAVKEFGKHVISSKTGEIVVGDSSIRDDRLSPMTYRKLKEFGYTPQQWKNWNQEQANKVIASRMNKQQPKQSQKKEETSNKGNQPKTVNKPAEKKNNSQEEKKSASVPKSFGDMNREQIVDYFSGGNGEELVNKLDKKTDDIADKYYDGDTERATYAIQNSILKKSGHKESEFGEDTYSGGLLLMFDDPQSYLDEGDSKRLDFFKAGLEYLGIDYDKNEFSNEAIENRKKERERKAAAKEKEEQEKHSKEDLMEELESTTDTTLLKKHSMSDDSYVRARVAVNKNTPIDILNKLSKDEDDWVRGCVAKNENTTEDTLKKLYKNSKKNDVWVTNGLVENPNTPVDVIRSLARDTDEPRMEIALNKNVTPDILEMLSKNDHFRTRAYAAKNKKMPVNILEKLSDDRDNEVRWSVAENPKTPVSILKKLSEDGDNKVSSIAKEALKKRKAG